MNRSHTGALCASGCPLLHLSFLSLHLHFTISRHSPLQYIYFTARVKRLRKNGSYGNFFYCVRTWRWRRKAANPLCWPSGKGRHIYSKLNHSPHKCTSSFGRDISALRNKYSKAPCKLLFNALDSGTLSELQVFQIQVEEIPSVSLVCLNEKQNHTHFIKQQYFTSITVDLSNHF